jgi:Zn-dependent M16 (insulinase) family peptidase
VVASDASFANNSTDRKSSQAFAMKLFGGLIGWRANKQDTVTTLTTKAELLALAQAAKESMYVNKLLQKLIIDLND